VLDADDLIPSHSETFNGALYLINTTPNLQYPATASC
jgi:hypothetical protein